MQMARATVHAAASGLCLTTHSPSERALFASAVGRRAERVPCLAAALAGRGGPRWGGGVERAAAAAQRRTQARNAAVTAGGAGHAVHVCTGTGTHEGVRAMELLSEGDGAGADEGGGAGGRQPGPTAIGAPVHKRPAKRPAKGQKDKESERASSDRSRPTPCELSAGCRVLPGRAQRARRAGGNVAAGVARARSGARRTCDEEPFVMKETPRAIPSHPAHLPARRLR